MIALDPRPSTVRQPASRPVAAPLSIAPRGSTVEVSFFDRPPLFGYVDIFDPAVPEFFVRKSVEKGHLMQVVPFERVRHVAFLRRTGVKSQASCASTARLVELRLLDGGTLRGITHGHGGQRRGLFLVPVGVPGIERFYVPIGAIQEVLSARTLGELLCGGPATIERVEATVKRELAEGAAQALARAAAEAAGGKPKLGEILLDQGFISREDLGGALEAQAAQRGRRLGELLIDLGLVSHKMIAIGLAVQHGVPFLSLAGKTVDPELRTVVPAEVARRYGVMPLARTPEVLRIAVADPGVRGLDDELHVATGLALELVVAIPQEIARAQQALYG